MKFNQRTKTKITNNFLENLLLDRQVLPINEKERELFLNPSIENEHNPELLDHMKEGWELLQKHISKGSHLYIPIDPDVDGYTSASLVWNYLTDLQDNFGYDFSMEYHVPDGKEHGLDNLMDILGERKVADLIICADSSSNDYEQHKQLRSLGYDILVLDHHEAERYSEDAIVINNQLSQNYPNKALSGVGVVYKFFEYVEAQITHSPPTLIQSYLDLVALGMKISC